MILGNQRWVSLISRHYGPAYMLQLNLLNFDR